MTVYAESRTAAGPYRSTVLRVVLAALAAGSFLFAGLGYAVWFDRIPPTSDLRPVTGTVQRTRVLSGETENFVFVLSDGQRFVTIRGDANYLQVKEAVKDGVTVSMLTYEPGGGPTFAQLEVDGQVVVSLAEARAADRDYIRMNLVIAVIFTILGMFLLGTLALSIWEPPRLQRRRLVA